MRDTPRDIRPGSAALIGQLVSNIVEGEYRPIAVANTLDGECALTAVDWYQHIRFGLITAHEFIEFGRNRSEAPALQLLLTMLEQRLGRAVEQADAKPAIDRNYTRGNARQHSLNEGAASIELRIRAAQRVGLFLEPPGHPVERGRQRLYLVFSLRDRHPN